MNLNRFMIALKWIGYAWCILALIITWVSHWAIIKNNMSVFGITVFDVKDSSALALLLFPGALIVLLSYAFERWFSIGMSKKSALKQYIVKLGPLLAKRYGKAEHYTYGQVKQTVSECGLNATYAVYAYAIFLNSNDFDNQMKETCNENISYSQLREEVSHKYFHNNSTFDATSVCKVSGDDDVPGMSSGDIGDGSSSGDSGDG